ncbi:hypothetical protein XBKB1_3530003 [Xenorhabdus bovienii str. kraussei Becker Underwood]|uniref:Uncharacterized protein n=1 Tax=Xenorhabdus bovienii str. kraussei Becker Underwood TaxID=1398204 RepID=A0A077PWF5_XENBV|nr:hypothetical protein XBKB1_3530003 [Xenorhabdus bovienii str. kraussei Becker Underwood]
MYREIRVVFIYSGAFSTYTPDVALYRSCDRTGVGEKGSVKQLVDLIGQLHKLFFGVSGTTEQ